ncbi:abortive infection family protein [Pseudomonas putida]|uniref:abortive infection family protein n=1 Tax=Pseudomonas putida TaxID=303 RepID=UPI002363DD77|nr:abortive infection family protein [Pseudomonas putida]MDD1963883.1 abortive infection family protein [Pseudomonas putida]
MLTIHDDKKRGAIALVSTVLDTRSEIRAGLEIVEQDLRESLNGLSLYFCGKRITFGKIDEDAWAYGMLSFDGQSLRILTSDTMEDAQYFGTPYEGLMSSFHISDFNDDDKITKLASPESIESLWLAAEVKIREKLGEAKSAARLLSEFSDDQSESIDRDLSDLMQGDYFEKQWAGARSIIDVDASDSLTRSNQFLESVCRHYLDKRQIPLGNKKTITELINAVVDDFPPIIIPDGTDHSKDIKSLLGGMKSIAQGTGALRTHLGTAHGGDKEASADIARLSNNLAGAVAIYILQKLKAHMSNH